MTPSPMRAGQSMFPWFQDHPRPGRDHVFMQPEMLKSYRLDVPVIPRLIKNLRDNGIDVSMAYTYDEAQKSLLGAFRKGP